MLIAMAIMHRPALLIADEATSALDVITQTEILALFRELNRSTGMAILYISHDLASVAGICDRIAILDHGENRRMWNDRPDLLPTQARIHAAINGGASANLARQRKIASENRSGAISGALRSQIEPETSRRILHGHPSK